MEQIWNKLRKNYLFISENSFPKLLKNSFVLSNQLDMSFCLSYVMFVMYVVTESVNTQQDKISYDDNALYLIPR